MTDNINIGGISRMHTSPELSGLVDGIDFPHSGLFKSLSSAVQGNYAIINSATSTTTNFGIIQTGTTTTTLNVSTGQVMRDGKLMPAVTLASTPFVVGAQDASNIAHFDYRSAAKGGGNSYYLLVVDASNVIQMRHNGAPPDGAESNVVDIIPQLTAGDIPIAVVRLAETDAVTGRLIQYLTTAKEENSVSIGYNDTGYTETGTIQGLAAGTTVTNSVGDVVIDNTVVDKKIIARLGTDSAATGFEIRDNSDSVLFSVGGAGTTTFSGAVTGVTGFDTVTNSDITIKNTVSDKDIIFNVNDGGVDTEVMRIDGSSSKVGVGVVTPSALLHIKDTAVGDNMIIESTDSGAVSAPNLVLYRSSASVATDDVLGNIEFRGRNVANNADLNWASIVAIAEDSTGSGEDGKLSFSVLRQGNEVEYFSIGGIGADREIVFNDTQTNIDFRIETAGNANMLFVNGGLNRVGIGTNTPSEVLDVDGVVGMAGIKRKLVVCSSGTSPAYDLATTTLYTLLASAPDLDNNTMLGGNLIISLPAASSLLVGTEYQIIVQTVGLGDMSLTPPVNPSVMEITAIGSDSIVDELGTVIAAAGAGHTLLQGKIYKMLCINGTHWMIMQLN